MRLTPSALLIKGPSVTLSYFGELVKHFIFLSVSQLLLLCSHSLVRKFVNQNSRAKQMAAIAEGAIFLTSLFLSLLSQSACANNITGCSFSWNRNLFVAKAWWLPVVMEDSKLLSFGQRCLRRCIFKTCFWVKTWLKRDWFGFEWNGHTN